MEGAAAVLPPWATALAWLLAVTVLLVPLRGLSLERYRGSGGAEACRVLLVATVLVVALRWLNTAALQGVVLHFLGASVVTLMFGGRVAGGVMALASLAAVLGGAAWQGSWPLDFLLSGALPVAVTVGVGVAARYFLPGNIITYVMVNAFGAAALAMATSMLSTAALAAMLSGPEAALGGPATAYLVATPLLMLGEAFLTGGVMVTVVVYRPQWCPGFDDRTYFGPGRSM